MLTRLVRRFVSRHRGLLIATLALQAAQATAGMLLPYLNADLIDRGVVTGSTTHILRVGSVMLAVTVAQVALSVAGTYFAARLALSVGRDARAAVYASVQQLAASDVARIGVPSLITRTTGDVQQLQMIVALIGGVVLTAPFSAIAGVVLALRQDVRMSLVLAVAVPVLLLASAVIIVRLQPLFALQQHRIDTINRILREQIAGTRVIRAFGREEVEQRRFDETNDELTSTALAVGQRLATIFPVVLIVANLSSVAVLWVGGRLVDSGSTPVGTVSAFLTYLTQVLTAVTVAAFALSLLPRARISAGRLAEVLDAEPTVRSPREPAGVPDDATVDLERVGLIYATGAAPVLHDVSFRAEPGTMTVIVGRTGAGKSVLLATICRAVDPTTGQVRLGGSDVRGLDLETLWSRVAMVTQQPRLFRGTIATNLRFTRRLREHEDGTSDEVLWEALRVAHADSFVRELPDGLDAAVAPGGSNLSTGQRQRLCIARALVDPPDVLLLDDVFAAMDYATDAAVRSALRQVTRRTTVILTSQRLAPALDADRVLVLDEGRVAGFDTHERLLHSCRAYEQLFAAQLGEAVP